MGWAAEVETPAFVLDEAAVQRALAAVDQIRRESGARVLYALKPLAQPELLGWMRGRVDGFAASSLFEARLGREVLSQDGILSITTPCYRDEEMERLAALCDHVVLNSLSQWERFSFSLLGRTSVGLRVNPGLSSLDDGRYDPCRPASKLGVPLAALAALPAERVAGIEGVHFHTNCGSETFDPLLQTVCHLVERLDPLLRSVRWINLGGGYSLARPQEFGPLYRAVSLLRERYGVSVLLEPGAALVREAGYLVATVRDLFEADGARVAVLDTSVNHAPEVFEYQLAPLVVGHAPEHPHGYLLAGATCLAGDLFGGYRFAAPLRVGSRVVFAEMGAYTLVKAHMFNGVNLPALYTVGGDGGIVLRRRFGYEDYRGRIG